MAKEETKGQQAAMQAAVEKANAEAGYDIPVAFAALNSIIINEQTDMGGVPLFESQVDMTAAADIILRATGGTLTADGLSVLLNFGVAYGWHRCSQDESLLRSESVWQELAEYIDKDQRLLVAVKADRKKGLEQGREALAAAVKKSEERMKVRKAVGK